MKNFYLGESIYFECVLTDQNGTALTTETPVVKFYDFGGTNQDNGTGTHITGGSYVHTMNTDSTWGTGPARYHWEVKGTFGTLIEVDTNLINLISGTVEPESYVYLDELSSYYGRIGDYFDENSQEKLRSVYHYVNRHLDSLGVANPVKKNANGIHDESLRLWQANWTIYELVKDREANRISDQNEVWFDKFKIEGDEIWKAIKDKKISFEGQQSPAESGVGTAERTAGSSIATMVTNSHQQTFKGSDFERTWLIDVIGTGTTAAIHECLFRWSSDNARTFGTSTTSDSWVDLTDGVQVRWNAGTKNFLDGTSNVFAIGDRWSFVTRPRKDSVGGIRRARAR